MPFWCSFIYTCLFHVPLAYSCLIKKYDRIKLTYPKWFLTLLKELPIIYATKRNNMLGKRALRGICWSQLSLDIKKGLTIPNVILKKNWKEFFKAAPKWIIFSQKKYSTAKPCFLQLSCVLTPAGATYIHIYLHIVATWASRMRDFWIGKSSQALLGQCNSNFTGTELMCMMRPCITLLMPGMWWLT